MWSRWRVRLWILKKTVLGLKHHDTLNAMADLNRLLLEQARYGEAESIGKKVVKYRQR